MLTAKPQLNLRNAREYFREHLSVGDYYSADQKVTGEWFGQGAQKLGLKDTVAEQDFLRLCEGLHPATGERLTQRKNSSRRGQNGRTVANRRVFYDFTLSPPKSVSIVGLYRDDRILNLHNRAVKLAMTELERFAETRVRKSGQRGERNTGNVVGASFRHDTSRELDPHLHTHCVVFNATYDPVETRWKALEVQGMYRAQKFAENYYFHELARGLRALGYEIEPEGRAFRLAHVPASVVAQFSKRRQEIDRETENRIKRDGWRGNVKDLREQVAREVRKRKARDSTAAHLRSWWEKQMTAAEIAALKTRRAQPAGRRAADVPGIVAWADEFLFERRSVVHEHELLAAALARGRGEDFDLAALRAAVARRGYICEPGGRRLTSREVLLCELEVVVAAHDGRGRYGQLNALYRPARGLAPEQRTAVTHLLGSRDFITLFRGGAGTGKSFTLKEVGRGLAAAARPVVVLAPQRQQARDLQAAGLAADTLARFLQIGVLASGAVVLLDEAGQVGGRQLRDLIQLVRSRGGRLILSGDTRQHGAVAASDALRAIETHAGLKPAVLRQVRRQDPALATSVPERQFIRRYRAAVQAAARGNVAESFDRLERLGCIRERGGERRRVLAEEYLGALVRRQKVLVVAQTREEVRAVNEAVREKLRVAGRLGAGTKLRTFQPLDLGEAQKRDPHFYASGQHAFFLQRYGRFAKGELVEVAGATTQGLVLLKGGRRSTLSYRYANRLSVATPVELEIAPGDRLQLKFNGRSGEDRLLHNGELVTVHRVRRNGALVVEADDGTRRTLSPAQRLFVRGFAVTSYGSQGKTVDTVLLADAENSAATNANQWYVSITRGRRRVVVFTPDKEGLRAAIQRLGDRELALEMPVEVPAALRAGFPSRALAAIERQRQHRIVLERTRRHAAQQKVAV